MTPPRVDVEMRTWRVHVPLGLLFGVLWLLTALHLVVLDRREVWPWGAVFILNCAAPPLMPAIHLALGNFASAGFHLLPLVLVAVPWWLAARNPEARVRVGITALIIVAYWLFFDFGLAFSA